MAEHYANGYIRYYEPSSMTDLTGMADLAAEKIFNHVIGTAIKNHREYGDAKTLRKALALDKNNQNLVLFYNDSGTLKPIQIEPDANGKFITKGNFGNIKEGTPVLEALKDKNIVKDVRNASLMDSSIHNKNYFTIGSTQSNIDTLAKGLPAAKKPSFWENLALHEFPKFQVKNNSGMLKRAIVNLQNVGVPQRLTNSGLGKSVAKLGNTKIGSLGKSLWRAGGIQLPLAIGDAYYRYGYLDKVNSKDDDTFKDQREELKDRLDNTGRIGEIDPDADFVTLSDLGNSEAGTFGRTAKAVSQFVNHPIDSIRTYKTGLFDTPQEQEAKRQEEAYENSPVLNQSKVNQDLSDDGSTQYRYGTLGDLDNDYSGSKRLFEYSHNNSDIDDVKELGERIQSLNEKNNRELKFGHFDNDKQRFIWDKAKGDSSEILTHLTNKHGQSFIDYLGYLKQTGQVDEDTYNNIINYGLHHDKKAGTVRDYLGNGNTVIQAASILPSDKALADFSDFDPSKIKSQKEMHFRDIDPYEQYDIF